MGAEDGDTVEALVEVLHAMLWGGGSAPSDSVFGRGGEEGEGWAQDVHALLLSLPHVMKNVKRLAPGGHARLVGLAFHPALFREP